ncbi:MAG: response regulator [Nitrosopumilus sp.]|nr:response regulator [Nitrosopumilus sp.]
MKILGIDDNADITDLLDTVLNGSSHQYSFVDNGKDGINLIRQNKYDLVLLDLAMPEFSGLDVLDELKKENLTKKQKIVIFTASSIVNSEIESMVKEKGAYSYLRKPIDVDQLLKYLDEINED